MKVVKKEDIMSIPEQFFIAEYKFTLMMRKGNVALYCRRSGRFGRVSYEVVYIRKEKDDNTFMRRVKGQEYLPGTSDWGKYGLSWGNLPKEKLERKFEEKYTEWTEKYDTPTQ